MPTFTKEEIVHLGDLARIALSDEEITRLQGELNVIADIVLESRLNRPPTRFRWKRTCAPTFLRRR